MAFSRKELRTVRNAMEKVANRNGVAQTWTKPEINAAIQAIEGRWDAAGTQAALSADIEAAALGVFTNAEKKHLAAFWLIGRGKREKELI